MELRLDKRGLASREKSRYKLSRFSLLSFAARAPPVALRRHSEADEENFWPFLVTGGQVFRCGFGVIQLLLQDFFVTGRFHLGVANTA